MFPKGLENFKSVRYVCELEDEGFFCAGIGAAAFGIDHQWGNAGQFFDIGGVVARRDDTFAVKVDYIIAHHFATDHLAERRQRGA